ATAPAPGLPSGPSRSASSSRRKEPRDDVEESSSSVRMGFHLGYALAEQVFQGAAEAPVPGELAEPVELGFAHVAPEHELVPFGIKVNPILQIGRDFIAVREPVELDEVIHGTLHQRARQLSNPGSTQNIS